MESGKGLATHKIIAFLFLSVSDDMFLILQYEYYYTYTCVKFGKNCKGL